MIKSIWYQFPTLEQLNQRGHETMPVDARTKQPMGILYGGANVALAETLASVAANVVSLRIF